MYPRIALLIAIVALVTVCPGALYAQEQIQAADPTRVREGVYEITLKTPDSRKIIVDELVRDRDLNPRALFRVKTGGYLAFSEDEWVDKIEYRVFDIPVTAMPEYQKFTDVLVGINDKIFQIKRVLQEYDELSLRLMNLCDRSLYPSLEAIDENIALQLSIYRRLLVLRSLVVNSLNRFVAERSCVDRFTQFKKDLELYSKRLTNLCKNFDRLKKKTLDAARGMQSASAEAPQSDVQDEAEASN